jgi:5-formaminoimidazole-4-carboxamide-1-beta-D-ribofuranosyl 5'-monophosphate synthetase
MDSYDKQEARILKILGGDNAEVSDESLEVYLDYLKEHITKPCEFKFGQMLKWEEYYILGPGDKQEYERLKKTRLSCKDILTLVKLDDYIDDDEGLMVKVRKADGKKQYAVALIDLEVVDKKSPNYQLVEDYNVWFVNQ